VSVYVRILRTPGVATIVLGTLIGRMPIGISGLAILLFVREVTGSFASAGLCAGALALGSAVGAPLQGRLIDRRGVWTLLPLAAVHAAGLLVVWAAGQADAPTATLAAASLVTGAATPPVSSVLRSRWPFLLADTPELIPGAFALDSVMIELIFVLGPLLTAALATLLSPQAALVVSAASVIAGTIAFTALPPARELRPAGNRIRPGLLGALGSPGVRTLVLTSLPAGVGIGICEVALPAFSHDMGAPSTAGVLLALWSIGSAAGGLVYGALRNRPPLNRVHIAIAAGLPVSLLPMAAAPSVAVMALIVIPAGIFVAPLLATRNELIGWVAPEGSRTEAYTWPVTAFVGGIAVGSALAGALVEAASWRTAFLVAGAFAFVGTLVAVARRGTVVQAAAGVS
jgi:MFS family permease